MMNIVSGFAAIIADLGLLGAGILDISSLIIHVGVFITDELIYLGMQVPQLLITVLQIAQHAVSVLKWAQNIVSFLYPGSLIDGLLGKITNDARPAIVQWGSRILGLAGDRVSAVSFEPGQNYDAGVRQLNSDDPITVYDPCVAYSLSGCTW
ncbi:MAG TPA: hypothetical protein VKX46_00170 [Ktedonobacteraceae bacterium]|nr:hypothetical protein [Ktedonobacteraceae bacterium]